MEGVIKSFKKDQGFGTFTSSGQDLPFDYEVCVDFPDHPKEGDLIDVTMGTSRLGRPKAMKVQFMRRDGAAPADPKANQAKQIAKDLEEYTRRGAFKDVDTRWIVEQGLAQGDRLDAVARYYLRDAPKATVEANPTDLLLAVGVLFDLFPEINLVAADPEGEKTRLTLVPQGSNKVTSALKGPLGVMKLFNTILPRIAGMQDRVFLIGPADGQTFTFTRASLPMLQKADPEKVLPIWLNQ